MKPSSQRAAICILRVSSHRQKDNSSHDTQEQEIKRYCEKQNLNLHKSFTLTESAKRSEDRKQYHAAIKYALDKKIPDVIFYMFDRETRNLRDNERNEDLVRQGLLRLHYARDNKIIDKEASDTDFFARDMNAMVSKQFIRNLRTKVVDAQKHKAAEGWWPANHVALGYMHQKLKDSDGKELRRGTIIVSSSDPQEIAWVQKEFELRALGYSYEEIRTRCLEMGIVPHKRRATYYMSAVEKRIKNPFYRGHYFWGGEKFYGKHPLIIPKEYLEKIDAKPLKTGITRVRDNKDVIFAHGFLKCADKECGCHIVYDPKVKKNRKTKEVRHFPYYRCTNGRKVHETMKGRNVSEQNIWDQFEEAWNNIELSPGLAKEMAAAIDELKEKAKKSITREMNVYREELRLLEVREDDLYADVKKEILSDDSYQRMVGKVRDERAYYTDLLEKAQHMISDTAVETAHSIIELCKGAKSKWVSANPQERKALLEFVLSNPVLDGVTLRYDLRKPFSLLAEMKKNPEWRSQGESNPCCVDENHES